MATKKAKNKLNPKHKAVALGYMQGKSKAQACKDAGYACGTLSSATATASEILKKPETIEYIEKINEKIESPMIASIEESMMFLTAVARDTSEKMKNRLKATDMKLKAQGAYIERIEAKHDFDVRGIFAQMTEEQLRKMVAEGVESIEEPYSGTD